MILCKLTKAQMQGVFWVESLGDFSLASMIPIIVYLGLLAVFYVVSIYVEKSAALRGSKRKSLSVWTDKGLRMFFLLILTYPLMVLMPWVFIPLVVAYTPSFVDDGEKTGKRTSAFVRGLPIFHLVRWYFHLEVVNAFESDSPLVTNEGGDGPRLRKDTQYILGVHPHGFLPVGTLINMLSSTSRCDEKVFGGVHVRHLAASFCFFIPGYRDFILAGGLIDAARYNAKRALNPEYGMSLALVPGGATEALYAGKGRNTLVLRRRRGFIKLALETGAHLVPVYSFGENDCFNQLSGVFPVVSRMQAKIQRVLGISMPIVTNLIPNRAKITTVFGTPIEVPKLSEAPTEAQIDDLMDRYINALTALFNAHAAKYIENPEHRKLEIL